jgi:hypothetical protein
MTTDNGKPIMDELAKALTAADRFGISSCQTLGQLLDVAADPQARPSVRLLRNAKVRVAHYFDIATDILIYDPFLGTLGLVDFADGDSQALDRRIRELLDRGVHLRRLLLTEAKGESPPVRTPDRLPLTIEQVVVTPFVAESGRVLGELLKTLCRETAYFFSVGVGVLYVGNSSMFGDTDLHRAFAWLLRDTAGWYREIERGRPLEHGKTAHAGDLKSLELKDYRLAGTCTLELQEGHNIHFIHGYNGSGKSSLVEAAELLVTGKVERLERAKEIGYYGVIRHQPEQTIAGRASGEPVDASPVSVLADVGGKKLTGTITPDGVSIDPSVTLEEALSFRLDQEVMRHLVHTNDTERAERFLRAFFPEDRKYYQELWKARQDLKDAVAGLPKAISDELAEAGSDEKAQEEFFARFAWIPGKSAEPGGGSQKLDDWTNVLPIGTSALRQLGSISDAVRQWLDKIQTDPPTTIAEISKRLGLLDEALDAVRNELPDYLHALETASKVLEEFSDWSAGDADVAGEKLPDLLNKWLEAQALEDLYGKYEQLATVFREARRTGWKPLSAEVLRVALSDAEAAEISARRKQIETGRKEISGKISGVIAAKENRTEAAGKERGVKSYRQSLSDEEVERLDRASHWLSPETAGKPALELGTALRTALTTRQRATRGRLRIGDASGLQVAREEFEKLLAACRALRDAGGQKSQMRFVACHKAFDAFAALKAASTDVKKAFFSKIQSKSEEPGSLNAALNEVLTLLKPARWAYGDIFLQARVGEGDTGLGLLTGDQRRAELRLNTAELNALTLALFLLCAVRVPNPLGTLVLDDPLQNMDELTVTFLARGLAKILRFIPGWQVLAFFHGEDNLERVRHEIPCEVYQFPWQRPGGSKKPIQVEHAKELSTGALKLMILSKSFFQGLTG